MIVSCGEALIDFVPMQGAAGEVGYRPCPGGSPYNVAIVVARLGVAAGFLGRISSDFFGDLLVDWLKKNGVSTSFVRRAPQPSTLGFVSLADGHEPQYAFFSNGAADRSLEFGDLPESMPDEISCLQFGSISLMQEPSATTLEGLMRRESGRGVISFDPNVRPGLIPDRDAFRRRLEGWVALSDIVKVSGADVDWLYPGSDRREIAARWKAMGPSLVTVTGGEEGAYALFAGGSLSVPGRRVTVADTVGAGDSFHGALLAGLDKAGALDRRRLGELDAATLRTIVDRANQVAAITCSRPGCDPPYARELD